jgi:hypothetical protein
MSYNRSCGFSVWAAAKGNSMTTATAKVVKLRLESIEIDHGLQARAAMNDAVIEEYAQAFRACAKFPPIVVFFDGERYWLADGFHRTAAARRARLKSIDAEVRPGSRRDALLYALGSNADHGLRRTDDDKRKAVRTLLADPDWAVRSTNWIATVLHVSQPLVEKIRRAEGKKPGSCLTCDGRMYPTLSSFAVEGPPQLKAPFPAFGGKGRIAGRVWQILGDVDNYIEPCCLSAAVLLARPHMPRVETINDVDCHVANFWRATSAEPEAVARWVDWPVNEADLHARHRWLVPSEEAGEFRSRMGADPAYYDARVAGWWAWGLNLWQFGGWCTPTGVRHRKPPSLSHPHSGINAVASGRSCADRLAYLLTWFGQLRDRLCRVRVLCGDWRRTINSPSVTTRLGLTGIFFDPPYAEATGRDMRLYAAEDGQVAHAVRAWCVENGHNPQLRIVLCGLDGEHDELLNFGWTVEAWKASGGYGNTNGEGNRNAERERLWVSPHCIQ